MVLKKYFPNPQKQRRHYRLGFSIIPHHGFYSDFPQQKQQKEPSLLYCLPAFPAKRTVPIASIASIVIFLSKKNRPHCLVRYLTRAAKYINKDQLEKNVQKELPEWRSDYMTIADVLKKEGKIEDAINFYKMGLTIDQIAQGTRLDKETLKEILKDVER